MLTVWWYIDSAARTVRFSVTQPLHCIRFLTSRRERCGNNEGEKNYFRLSGTEYFNTTDNMLFAKESLDRDILGPPGGPGPSIDIEVNCLVWENNTGTQYSRTNLLTVDILDQDDNPPVVQGNSNIAITLQDFTVVSISTRCSGSEITGAN